MIRRISGALIISLLVATNVLAQLASQTSLVGMRFQIRAEIFNVFNTVNYGHRNASFGSAAFGRITSAGSMRQVQLGGKLMF